MQRAFLLKNQLFQTVNEYFFTSQKVEFLIKPTLFSKKQDQAKPLPPQKIAHKSSNSSHLLEEIQRMHSLHKDAVKIKTINSLKELSPSSFETFAKKLLTAYGFHDMVVTSVSNDGGIDGHGKLKVGLAYMNIAFQCKRWKKNNIGRPEIDKFRGAIQGKYEQGLFFTTSAFTKSAKNVSIRPGAVPIILVDGVSIVDLMIEKSFGILMEDLPIYSYALDLILADDNEK